MSARVPDAWAVVRLGEIADVQLGKMLSAKARGGRGARPYLRNVNIRWHRIDTSDVLEMDFDAREAEKYRLQVGDVLVCEGGEPGRSALWHEQLPGALYQKALHRVRFRGGVLDPQLLTYQLELAAGDGSLARSFTGSTIKHLPREALLEWRLAVPPLAEQRRLAAALEEHLSDLDSAVAGLERAREGLQLYKKACFDAAIGGSLAGVSSSQERIPAFEWRPLREVIAEISQGWSPKCDPSPPASDEDWGVIKTTAIQSARYDTTESKALPAEFLPRPELEIRVGDLLVTRKGPRARAGVAAAVRATRQRLMICDTVYRIKLRLDRVKPHYMAIALSAPRVAKAIDAAKAGISESGVSLTHDRLGAIGVPLPTLEVQEAIERETDHRLELVDRTAAEIDVQLARSARLRQAILKHAFEGKLVPQEPSDEPASALLSRIRSATGEPAASSARARSARQRSTARRGRA